MPAAVVVDVSLVPVAISLAVTVAPGIIAPVESVTNPLMAPRPAWANTAAGVERKRLHRQTMAPEKSAAIAFLFPIVELLVYIDSNV